jgi:IS30 family transposase
VGAMDGQSASAISRALERRNKTGVELIVVLHGGIVPAPRQRALAALKLEEREEISRGIAAGRSIRQIAQGLGPAPSTVSREIRRNGGSQAYRANRADRRAWERALCPKPCRLALHRELRWRVAQKLALQRLPEQIFGRWMRRPKSHNATRATTQRVDRGISSIWSPSANGHPYFLK